jgi:hypothetical protein
MLRTSILFFGGELSPLGNKKKPSEKKVSRQISRNCFSFLFFFFKKQAFVKKNTRMY